MMLREVWGSWRGRERMNKKELEMIGWLMILFVVFLIMNLIFSWINESTSSEIRKWLSIIGWAIIETVVVLLIKNYYIVNY